MARTDQDAMVAEIIDGDTTLKLDHKGLVTILSECLQLENGSLIPTQEIRVELEDLVVALTNARERIKEATGHDPLDRPEDRKVDSDS